MLLPMVRRPLALLPSVACNPVDTSDVAEYVVDCIDDGPKGMREEIGGPETLSFSEFGRQLREHIGARGRIISVPATEKLGRKFGLVRSTDGRAGQRRWGDWLKQRESYGFLARTPASY
jgi:uncharacterized protein YbjT (DUF2867 family)